MNCCFLLFRFIFPVESICLLFLFVFFWGGGDSKRQKVYATVARIDFASRFPPRHLEAAMPSHRAPLDVSKPSFGSSVNFRISVLDLEAHDTLT